MVASPEVCRMNGAKSKGAITERGKAMAARNATKHGLLSEKPPLLVSEDLATFQGLMQSLVNQYQPEGAVEWHLVQTIAMCIQRQNRLWVAEAAIGNAQVLPPKPSTDEKYPAFQPSQEHEQWSAYHPSNLRQERKLLTWLIERQQQTDFPAERRSRYFADLWQDWVQSTLRDLKRLEAAYPTDSIPGKPDDSLALIDQKNYASCYADWMRDLQAMNHPFAACWFYARTLREAAPPQAKSLWDYYAQNHATALEVCQQRLAQIEQIEQERRQEHDRYQQDMAERRALIANPVSQAITLLSRYESHISKQLEKALEQLQNFQNERKHKGSMGSFGQKLELGTQVQ